MEAVGGDGDVADTAGAGKISEGVTDDMNAVRAELEADQAVCLERGHQQRILPAGNRIRGVDGQTTGRFGWPMAFIAGSAVVDK